jgi:ATP-dependent DNA ligase
LAGNENTSCWRVEKPFTAAQAMNRSSGVPLSYSLLAPCVSREGYIKESVKLAVDAPVLPMLAKRVGELPKDGSWIFEPKWDGFRALIFRNGNGRDGDEILIQSRDTKPLNRYFPELLDVLKAQLPERCVLDGEIVIAGAGGLDFERLQLRIHPAASRVKLLAEQSPASVVFFDLLCEGEEDLRGMAFAERRQRLEKLLASAAPPLHITPATREREVALDWFQRFEGAGLDGVMAKPVNGSYEPDKRVMLKVKHERECDCVVAGFRWHKQGERTMVGSLLLGLFDDAGHLQHVGVCSSFTMEKRRELVELLAPYRENALADHPWRSWAEAMGGEDGQRMPGGQSRWSQGKDLSWEPLRPELVAEVAYEHMQGSRFRHLAHLRRWRPDKQPKECTYAQLEVVAAQELKEIFAAGR